MIRANPSDSTMTTMMIRMTVKGDPRGFNLIEIMIALAVLSIGLLGTAALIAGIVKGNMASKRVTVATTLMQDRMEDLASLSYDDLPSSGTEDFGEIQDFPDYKRVLTTHNDDPEADMKRIEIEVYWRGGVNPLTLQKIYVK